MHYERLLYMILAIAVWRKLKQKLSKGKMYVQSIKSYYALGAFYNSENVGV